MGSGISRGTKSLPNGHRTSRNGLLDFILSAYDGIFSSRLSIQVWASFSSALRSVICSAYCSSVHALSSSSRSSGIALTACSMTANLSWRWVRHLVMILLSPSAVEGDNVETNHWTQIVSSLARSSWSSSSCCSAARPSSSSVRSIIAGWWVLNSVSKVFSFEARPCAARRTSECVDSPCKGAIRSESWETRAAAYRA